MARRAGWARLRCRSPKRGAEVTGVCSTRNVDMVRSLGADHVIDYTQEDFTQGDRHYDLILDNVASRSFSELRRVLTPQGIIVPNSGHGGMGYVLKAFVLSPFTRQVAGMYLAAPNDKDLIILERTDRNRQGQAGD
jgi:NADPH:quinone reductase-like Zn-dependent oxidoreductase